MSRRIALEQRRYAAGMVDTLGWQFETFWTSLHYTRIENVYKAVFFYAVFGCQNDTLKFCNDTLNSEGQDVVLPCLEVKRFEEKMVFCTWLLQQTAAML